MMKKRFALFLALIMTLTAVSALAAGSMATPSDLYEREENDGHAHFAYCTDPHVCYLCGASVTVDANHTTHQNTEYVPYNATSHRLQCMDCGVVQETFEDDHIAYCDNTGVCMVCGWAGKIAKIAHDEHVVGDATGHHMVCSRCGATSSKQAHYAYCYTDAGICERCGEPFSGEARHFNSTKVDGYDAEYHWFKCIWCGKDIREAHYFEGYYWYEHEGEAAAERICGGCGVKVRISSTGKPTIVSGGTGSVYDSTSDVVAADRVQAIREGRQATWYGESDPMALVYAPKTGKATLRAEASADSKALGTLKDGTIMVVLDKGYRFTQVRVGDQIGYILRGAVELLDEEQLPIGEGMLIYPTTGGRGTTTINVRCEPSTGAVKVDEWPTGTMVLVWSVSKNGNWYEVEYDGLRGYVQAQYLNMTTTYDFTPIETDDEEI